MLGACGLFKPHPHPVGIKAGDRVAGPTIAVIGNWMLPSGHQRREMDSDAHLWERSRAGDSAAFTTLFRRHSKTIYNYCFRRLANWAEAEDAVSLVFLEAWRRRDKDLPPDKVLPWLYGIASNVLRNRHRAERRFRAALARS